jgi:hypothetical protein
MDRAPSTGELVCSKSGMMGYGIRDLELGIGSKAMGTGMWPVK